MSSEMKTAFGDGHREGPSTGTIVYFNVRNMVTVSDPEDASKTLEMENLFNFQAMASIIFQVSHA